MKNPRKIIADVAKRYVGVHEQSENWSPQIAKFWKATTIPDGAALKYPWCAAFVCFVVQAADAESEAINLRRPPKMPDVASWAPWARNVGALVFRPGKIEPLAGDIVDLLPRVSHIGVVLDFNRAQNVVVTIEGNTNAEGGREGVEVAVKYRALFTLGNFMRLPVVPVAEAIK